jgi:hypothetical protein
MPPPTWTVGQVMAANDVNQWLVPLVGYKTSDQSVTSSTVKVNDTGLVVTAAANCTYLFQCYLDYEGGTGGSSDMSLQIAVPASATLRIQSVFARGADGLPNNLINTTGALVSIGFRTQGAGVLCGASMVGTLVTLGTSGSVVAQWAQGTSSGTSTIIHAGSVMWLQRIS